jgi:hypothetical protein
MKKILMICWHNMKGIKKVLKRERIAKWKMEKPVLLPNWNLSLNLGKSIKTQNSNIVLFFNFKILKNVVFY